MRSAPKSVLEWTRRQVAIAMDRPLETLRHISKSKTSTREKDNTALSGFIYIIEEDRFRKNERTRQRKKQRWLYDYRTSSITTFQNHKFGGARAGVHSCPSFWNFVLYFEVPTLGTNSGIR